MRTIDEMIAVMTAYKEGKKIECKIGGLSPILNDDSKWSADDFPIWNWGTCDYRVKEIDNTQYIDMGLSMKIRFKKLAENAIMPTYGSEKSAGIDLYASETHLIYPRDRKLIKVGIAMEIPDGYYGMVVGRSGNTIKRGLIVATGIIDADYRGEIGVMLFNETGNNMIVKQGERVGQLILVQYPTIELVESAELSDTERGENGYGSTGR